MIKAFNSPFYPDVLVSTSVLQEGVDLHYHCSEIIHYGIAWTQGDNEQRVGRVDRMFGKLNTQLKENPNATLPIHYPYLKNTIDQDQVARFIVRKHYSEKLLDQLKNIQFSNEINFKERISEEEWGKYLNVPGKATMEHDPFPVDYSTDFSGILLPSLNISKPNDVDAFLAPLWNTIQERFGHEFVLFKKEILKQVIKKLFAVKHIRENQRHQPIIGEIGYSEPGLYFLKKPVYFIRLSTPFARRFQAISDINKLGIIQDIYNNNPLLKICWNREVKGFFRFYVCIDLPLFMSKDNNYNISQKELITAFETLIEFSDDLELKLYGTKVDIKNEEVIEGADTIWEKVQHGELSSDRGQNLEKGWKKSASNQYIYKEKELYTEPYEEIYQFNHKQIFLRKK
ncbi:MAG: hypothetical protein IPP15_16215 [Saprospiraceae bacterium]|uniref:Helicase C-terminal domain-containing protein n=1 Tax=Candidatus Opimibacter skivensis TaxID=2982028 RepID=A0A9D7SXP7_9BACT|nr:hypothetical protein [Candidatus Opimibacter skivensis]